MSAAVVNNPQEWMEALRAGCQVIDAPDAIVMPEPVDLADYLSGAFFALRGGHGFAGGFFYRGFPGPQPMLTASHEKNGKTFDWSFNFDAVTFDGQRSKYGSANPDDATNGDNLVLPWVQLTRFRDVWVVQSARNGATLGPLTVNASDIDIRAMDNARLGLEVNNTGGCEWRGGAERNGANGWVLTGRADGQGGPTIVDSPHFERDGIRVVNSPSLHLEGFTAPVSLRGGYGIDTGVEVVHCRDFSYDGRGQYIDGATVTVDGQVWANPAAVSGGAPLDQQLAPLEQRLTRLEHRGFFQRLFQG